MPSRANPMATQTRRGGNGKFRRTADTRQRDHRAAELHGQGWAYQRIADELGFASKGHAHNAVMRAFAEIPTEGSADAKALDLYRIDRLIEWNWATMLRPHVAVSNGRVVGKVVGVERDEDGAVVYGPDDKPVLIYEDVLDDGPGQASAREIRALVETRAKIIGYLAPARSRIEVITEDVFDREIADVARQVAENDARQAADTGTA